LAGDERGSHKGVSGGFKAGGDGIISITGSKRAGKRGWRAEALNSSFADATLTAHAYCSSKARRLDVRSEQTTIQAETVERLTPRCARGKDPVSGGFETLVDPQTAIALPNVSRLAGRGWRVQWFSGPFAPVTGRAFAYCD
jgi:hypothetical protein